MNYNFISLTLRGLWAPFFVLIFCLSCGKNPSNKTSDVQAQQKLEGSYSGTFVPLNMPKVWDPKGVVKITLLQDEFHIIIAIRDITEAKHFQSLHITSRCPDDRSDKNLDGYIDARELFRSVGKIVVPLDDDLETQFGGGEFLSANYRYDQRVGYSLMMSDLNGVDLDLSDDVIKIRQRELPMNKLAVIVYGVPSSYELPETVRGRRGLSVQESLPIACATIRIRSVIPGEPDTSNPPPPHVEPVPVPVEPPVPPVVVERERPTSWRERIGSMWRRAWCRIRGCEAAGTFTSNT